MNVCEQHFVKLVEMTAKRGPLCWEVSLLKQLLSVVRNWFENEQNKDWF